MEDGLDTARCKCGHPWLDHDPSGSCVACKCALATATDFDTALAEVVRLSDGEEGHHTSEFGENRIPTQYLRRNVTTYEGSEYRVLIIGPLPATAERFND